MKSAGQKTILKVLLILLLSVIHSPNKSHAQVTSEGKLFYMSFMGMNLFSGTLDSQIIYITSKYNTKAYIDNPLRFGSLQTVTVQAGKVNRIFVLPSFYHPDTSSEIASATNTYGKMGIRIKSDAPIYVYAMSLEQYRSGATYVLPYTAIPAAPEFYVMTHTPTTKNGSNWVPSEFVVVGMDNNVEVEITPTFKTKMGRAAGTPFTVTLKAGQSYQVQSNYTSTTGGNTTDGTSVNGDFTGTRVRVINGCGKVNVFCGNSGAVVIDQSGGTGGCGISQDHLFTQCIPTTLLGKNYTLVPYFGNSKGYTFKVLAVVNNTVVKVDGTTVATLNAGQRYYGNITTAVAKCITTSEKSMVCQFAKSEQCSGATDADPDIVIIPDNSQMLNYSINGTATTSSMKKHYCNILVRKTAKNALFINGTKISSSLFVDVPCGNYSYYQASFANPSTNILECDSGFIAQSYGFGDKESYAFCAGALFENLEYNINITRANKCPGYPVNMKAVHSGTVNSYTWYFGDGSKDTGKIVSHIYKTPGKYFINLKMAILSACGQVDTVTRSSFLDVYPGPVLDFPDTTSLCGVTGVNFNLDAGSSPKFTFSWQDGSKTRFYNVKSVGKYKVTVLDTSTNCSLSDSTYVRTLPGIVAGYKADTIRHCIANNKFAFSEKSTFLSGDVYQTSRWEYWGKFNVKYKVANDSIQVSFDTTGSFPFNYIVTSKKGCMDTFSGTFDVVNRPTAVMASNKAAWCQKENAIFMDSSYGDGGVGKSYWEYGDGKKDTITGSIVHTYKYSTFDTFAVRLITESTWGCRDTVDSNFIVYPLPLPKIQATTVETCLNNNKFDFKDISTIPLGTYQNSWRYNGTKTSHAAQITGVKYVDTGIKTVVLIDTSNFGCMDSASAKVHVSPKPLARILISDSVNCFKQHYFDMADQSSFYSGTLKNRVWKFSDGTSSNSFSISKKTFLAYGSYTVKLIVTSKDNCIDSITKVMNVYYSPQASFSINDSVQCLQGNSFSFTPTVTPPTGVTQNNNWNFGNSTTSTSTNPTISYVDTGKYLIKRWVTTNKGCKDSSVTKHTFVNKAPRVGFTVNADSFCVDKQNFNFTNTSTNNGAMTYSWDLGDGSKSTNKDIVNKKYGNITQYTVKLVASSTSGCKDSVSKTVTVFPLPIFSFSVNDSIQCITGNTFQITNTSIYAGMNVNWNWSLTAPGGGNTNYTTSSIVNQSFTNIGNGILTLSGVTDKGCTSPPVSHSLQVLDTPTVFIDFADDCAEVPIDFKATIVNDPATGVGSHFWSIQGDGYTSTAQNFTHAIAAAGNYKVSYTFTNSEGCKSSDQDFVDIFPKPVADFNINYLGSRAMDTDYEFTSTSTGASTTDWLFGDNQTFTSTNFKTTFHDTGRMSARLIVSNSNGCADTVTKMLYLKPELQMWIPTSFTPNNDFVNDDWGPSTTFGITKYRMRIYDRWGALVFNTTDPNVRWNGKYNNGGNALPDGVYAYLISFRYIDGKIFVYKGDISLLH